MTTRGMMKAETVVLAAGVWSRRLARGLRLSLPLEPAKGYSVTVRRPEGVPDDLALYLPEGHACVTPFGDGLRFAGTLELSGMNDRVLTNRVAAIRRGAGATSPASSRRRRSSSGAACARCRPTGCR